MRYFFFCFFPLPLLGLEVLSLRPFYSSYRPGCPAPLILTFRTQQTGRLSLFMQVGKYRYRETLEKKKGVHTLWLRPILWPPFSPLSLKLQQGEKKVDASLQLSKALSQLKRLEPWEFWHVSLEELPPSFLDLEGVDGISLLTSSSKIDPLLVWVGLGGLLAHSLEASFALGEKGKKALFLGHGAIFKKEIPEGEKFRRPFSFRPSPLEDEKAFALLPFLLPKRVFPFWYSAFLFFYSSLLLLLFFFFKNKLWGSFTLTSFFLSFLLLGILFLFFPTSSFQGGQIAIFKVSSRDRQRVGWEGILWIRSLGGEAFLSFRSPYFWRPLFYRNPETVEWGVFSREGIKSHWEFKELKVFYTRHLLSLASPLWIEQKGRQVSWKLPQGFTQIWKIEKKQTFFVPLKGKEGKSTWRKREWPFFLKKLWPLLQKRYLNSDKFLLLVGPPLDFGISPSKVVEWKTYPSLWIWEISP